MTAALAAGSPNASLEKQLEIGKHEASVLEEFRAAMDTLDCELALDERTTGCQNI